MSAPTGQVWVENTKADPKPVWIEAHELPAWQARGYSLAPDQARLDAARLRSIAELSRGANR